MGGRFFSIGNGLHHIQHDQRSGEIDFCVNQNERRREGDQQCRANFRASSTYVGAGLVCKVAAVESQRGWIVMMLPP